MKETSTWTGSHDRFSLFCMISIDSIRSLPMSLWVPHVLKQTQFCDNRSKLSSPAQLALTGSEGFRKQYLQILKNHIKFFILVYSQASLTKRRTGRGVSLTGS